MLLERDLKIAQEAAFSVPLKITVENSFPKVTRNIRGDCGHLKWKYSTKAKALGVFLQSRLGESGFSSSQCYPAMLPATNAQAGWGDEQVLLAARSPLLLTITLYVVPSHVHVITCQAPLGNAWMSPTLCFSCF